MRRAVPDVDLDRHCHAAPNARLTLDYRNAYVSAVPESGTLALFAAGLVWLGLRRLRQHAA